MHVTSPPPGHRGTVAVVGTGIVGLACAFHLQAEGWDVRLLDQGDPASGASRGNAGALAFTDILPLASPGIMRRAPRWLADPLGPLSLSPGHLPRALPWLLRFWHASRPHKFAAAAQAQAALMRLAASAMADMLDAAGLRGHLRTAGNLELYESEAELAAVASGWAMRDAEGIVFEHVRGDGLAALQPGLSPRFVAGTWTPGWQSVDDPHVFALALHDAIAARGGAFTRASVQTMRSENDGVVLQLADGTVLRADRAVLAAGAWSRPLAAALGDRVPLDTERGYNTTLPPGAFDLRRQLTFGGHGFVVSPVGGGVRVGGAVELAGLRRAPNFARSDAMLRKAAAFLPGLRTDGGTRWMGFRPSMPDSLPVIGLSAATPRVAYAFGHGHLGLTQSAATGRLVAALLDGRAPETPIRPFRPGRFRLYDKERSVG